MMAPVTEIEKNIIQRILRHVAEDLNPDRIPQPMLIAGSEGSGKSSLLQSLANSLANNDTTATLPIFDGKQFFSSRDIIGAIEEHGTENKIDIDNKTEKIRRIVMIDDLDYYFKRSDFDDQYLLRSYLNKETAPLLIATISGIDASLADYKAPFFEGVRLVYVPALSISTIDKMDISSDKKRRIATLMEYLPPVVRSLKTASNIVEISEDQDNDLKELVSSMAPQYRAKLENLPVYSQKILYSLANSDSPQKLSDLRVLTGLDAGILSTYLRQLLKSEDIRKTSPEKRGTPYQLSDRLFKLWLAS